MRAIRGWCLRVLVLWKSGDSGDAIGVSRVFAGQTACRFGLGVKGILVVFPQLRAGFEVFRRLLGLSPLGF